LPTLQEKVQCCLKHDVTKPDVIGNRFCEGTDCLKAALRSGMKSLQVLVAYKKCGLGEQLSRDIAVSRAFTKHPDIHSENTRFKTL